MAEQVQISNQSTIRSVVRDDLDDALSRRGIALTLRVSVAHLGGRDADHSVVISTHDCNGKPFMHRCGLLYSTFGSYDRRQEWIEAATTALVARWRQPMDDAAAELALEALAERQKGRATKPSSGQPSTRSCQATASYHSA